jgi:hypothetical protein
VSSEDEVAQIGIAWLDLTLNHNPLGALGLTGPGCVTCNQFWSTKMKNLSL